MTTSSAANGEVQGLSQWCKVRLQRVGISPGLCTGQDCRSMPVVEYGVCGASSGLHRAESMVVGVGERESIV